MSSAPALAGKRFAATVAGLLFVCLAAAGCASSSALHLGIAAEQRQDYDAAVVEYTKAVRENRDNLEARKGLDRAKLRAAQEHFTKGRRYAANGKLDQALAEYEVASELNPSDGEVDE